MDLLLFKCSAINHCGWTLTCYFVCSWRICQNSLANVVHHISNILSIPTHLSSFSYIWGKDYCESKVVAQRTQIVSITEEMAGLTPRHFKWWLMVSSNSTLESIKDVDHLWQETNIRNLFGAPDLSIRIVLVCFVASFIMQRVWLVW